jgi:uncharacterized protein
VTNELADHLRRGADAALEDEPVAFAYLYGSHAGGKERDGSDIDIAVFVDEVVPAAERLDLRLRAADKLERAVGAGPVEVAVLQDLPLRLQGRTIQQRIVIFSRDEPGRVRWESRVLREYFDFEPRASALDRALLRAHAERRR